MPALAAARLPELIGADDVVGVAWGLTLKATADALRPLALGTPVVQICGAVPGVGGGTGPSEVAYLVAERLGGSLHTLPAPALASEAARDELLRNDAVRPTVERFADVTIALVGIGATPAGAPADAAGHVLVHVFDANGHVLPSDLRAIAMPLEQLRAARVVAVAGGREKHAAILGALRGGHVDVLVTDEESARYALEAA